ncbi:MAG: hypothetical protein MUD01_26035 [Chloroflexaceae bacterium]|jgi:hypothetical protein|nr:hypothetical protein [Chloroflexaceae bacterium]
MAEPESILQLGIEAARDGNKEEARSLFRLLTRQEPNNTQAWLWLAGVAEGRDERQAALERVVELDPNNEMALKGLQALGVKPGAPRPITPVAVEPPPPAPAVADAPPSGRDRYDIDTDDPFAALDSLSDAMNESPAAVRRTETGANDTYDRTEGAAVGAAGAAAAGTGGAARAVGSSGRDAVRSARLKLDEDEEDEDDTVAARGGISPLLLAVLGLALLALLAIFLWPIFFPEEQTAGNGNQPASTAAPSPGVVGQPGANATPPPLGTVVDATPGATGTTDPAAVGTAQPGQTPAQPGQPGQGTAQPGQPAQPNPGQPSPGEPVANTDVSGANPAILPPNSPIESSGWLFDFFQPNYAGVILTPRGFQPQGRYVVVLVHAENRTGQAQPVPANFFVLKDAQGRVYEALPDVSPAYAVPGVNADLAHTQAVPNDGIYRSVAIIFDVAPDATDLVFFSRTKPDQGWLVLRRV